MNKQENDIKNDIKNYIDFYIYNSDKKRFLKVNEIAKYIYDYGVYYEKELNNKVYLNEEGVKFESYEMIDLFEEMFEMNREHETYSFCELELIYKPLIIFGITGDNKQIKRIKELKREMRTNNRLKKRLKNVLS
jgi:hypothetical protein|tara:strand:- start:703 stop:1104 length:402 start_codon:yes stop_codon:yes gene_type:complete